MPKASIAVFAIVLLAVPALAEDAPPAIKRTPLQAIDFPDGYKTVTGLAEIVPGGASGVHTHPGIETGYMPRGRGADVGRGAAGQHAQIGESAHDLGRRETRREERRQRARQGGQRVCGRQVEAAGKPGEVAAPGIRLAQERQHA